MASKKTVEIVKATAPVLEQHGETITKVFYKRLFVNHPGLKDVFNMTHQKKGTQPKVLANAIFQYACHIDKLEMLGNAVEAIAQKHSSLGISKEMYPIVGENLLAAIKEVLGSAATPEIMNAWEEAYSDLAQIFVQKEEYLYQKRETSIGGFRGIKKFEVVIKKEESTMITSFYLKRKDGVKVPDFIPGQYIALTVTIPNTTHKHTRNYSLSDSPYKDYLRISVKKEPGNPDGIVSNYLHSYVNEGDVLNIGMPSGVFTLKDSNKPLVLISGGVGITPLMSMYKAVVEKVSKPVIFIQCALNSNTHAFKEEVETHLGASSKSVIIYNKPVESDVIGENYDYKGYISLEIIKSLEISNNSDFYFCGPKPFMTNVFKILTAYGVREENINYEFFGPLTELV